MDAYNLIKYGKGKFIDKNILLNITQYGFNANWSTSPVVTYLIEEMINITDSKKITIGV